jgi:ferredoxin
VEQTPDIRILRERCVLCGGCVESCPQSGHHTDLPVLTLSQEGDEIRVTHPEYCIACFTCVEFCRACAIVMSHQGPPAEPQPDLFSARPANKIV